MNFSRIMVTLMMTTTIGFSTAHGQSAQSKLNLNNVLKKTFDDFELNSSWSQKTELSDRLELIASKWNKEWGPWYYLAYSRIILSKDDKLDDAKRDALLDQAGDALNKAVRLLGANNDETHVLAAYIANWRIAISPMSRYMEYGKIFKDHMRAAKLINLDNPRIYFLEGMAKYGMPKFVGGGKAAALPFLAKADSLFARETNLDIEKPYWGRSAAQTYLKICQSGE